MRKLALLVAVLVLSGCAQLPTGVSVSRGPELVLPQSQEFSYYSPPGPSAGASAVEIVSGFLNAGSAPQQNYATAREYLSSQFAQNWQPNAGVLVRSGIPLFDATSDSLVTVDLPIVAKVDNLGIYSARDNQTSSLRFQLVRENGELRISRAPNLTVVTAPVFNVVFRGYPIYFLDASRQSLVPDLRWFPSRTSTGTSLVNALLQGASDWLAPAVTTAIPAETKLTVDAVRVVEGVALVDFDANALTANSVDRSLLMAQLDATLIQLPGVQRVSVSINSNLQDISAASLRELSISSPTALGEKGVFPLIAGSTQAISGTERVIRNFDPIDYDISADSAHLVLRHTGGISQFNLSSLSSEEVFSDTRGNLLTPQIDSFGFTWVVSSDTQDQVFASNFAGDAKQVEWVSPGTRVAFAVSPEGARLAELVAVDEGFMLILRPIIRDLSGLPKSIGQGEIIAELENSKASLSWDNLNSVILIESQSSNSGTVFVYPVSGPRSALPATALTVKKVISGSGNASRYLLTDNDEVWALNGRNWRKVSDSSLAIAMQD